MPPYLHFTQIVESSRDSYFSMTGWLYNRRFGPLLPLLPCFTTCLLTCLPTWPPVIVILETAGAGQIQNDAERCRWTHSVTHGQWRLSWIFFWHLIFVQVLLSLELVAIWGLCQYIVSILYTCVLTQYSKTPSPKVQLRNRKLPEVILVTFGVTPFTPCSNIGPKLLLLQLQFERLTSTNKGYRY